jgi:hypothetical protein
MAALIGETATYSTWGSLRYPLVNMFNNPAGTGGDHNKVYEYCFYITGGFCFNVYASDGTLNYYTVPQVGDASTSGGVFGFSAWQFGGLKATGNLQQEYLDQFVGQTATDQYSNSVTITADAWNLFDQTAIPPTYGQSAGSWFDPPLTIGLMTRSW